jgi:Fuc2NAc and GlcNAc transferase
LREEIFFVESSILYIACTFLGGAGAWLVVRWGSGFGLLDKANDRSSHEGVVPKGGGIGILAAFLLASWVLALPILFWMCAGLIYLLSLYGDRREIPPKVRLSIQFLGSVGLLFGLFYWEGRGWPVYLLIPFFAVFIAGTANYYNFMDGINGIGGITGVVGFGLLAFYAYLSGVGSSFATLAICMSLSCLGFLPFNMPRAKVFMGDVGSILLGFVFAAMVVLLSKSLLDFVCLSAFLFLFYADELTTIVVRLKNGENLTRPHRRHLYQLLANEKGIAHWKISAGYGIFQLAVGLSVLALRPFGIFAVLTFLTACFLGFSWISFRVRKKAVFAVGGGDDGVSGVKS